jgi:hypothetical protein
MSSAGVMTREREYSYREDPVSGYVNRKKKKKKEM